jgi:integral membrane protein (TIGR01906 family)
VGPGAHARRIAGAWLIGAATALVLLGGSIAPFLLPPVVRFEQDRTNVAALTGFDAAELDEVTGALLSDLVLWRGSFDVAVGGAPVLGPAERSHMQDVRGVFGGFWVAVAAGLVVLLVAARRSKSPAERAAAWRAVRRGAAVLAVVVTVAGVAAVVAFDAAFELFHRLLFQGNYTFDPSTDRLVQLFPETFWSEIAVAVGVVIVGAALATAWLAGRRAASARVAGGAATARVTGRAPA